MQRRANADCVSKPVQKEAYLRACIIFNPTSLLRSQAAYWKMLTSGYTAVSGVFSAKSRW